MSNQKDLVEYVIAEMEPAMEADGGGCQVVSVIEGVVKVRLIGACISCPSKALTMKYSIEQPLKEKFDWIKEVERV